MCSRLRTQARAVGCTRSRCQAGSLGAIILFAVARLWGEDTHTFYPNGRGNHYSADKGVDQPVHNLKVEHLRHGGTAKSFRNNTHAGNSLQYQQDRIAPNASAVSPSTHTNDIDANRLQRLNTTTGYTKGSTSSSCSSIDSRARSSCQIHKKLEQCARHGNTHSVRKEVTSKACM